MDISGRGSRQDSKSGPRGQLGERADYLDFIFLVAAILALAGAASAIVIGFPQALEIVAAQANAAVAPPEDAQPAEAGRQLAGERGEENEPFVADDIRPQGTLYAGAPSGFTGAG